MAAATNSAILAFGTQTQLTVASPGAVSNGAYSAQGDVNAWTNTDNYPLASFVLVLNDLSAAAAGGDTVDLYCKPLNIVNTTGDHQGPNASLKSIYLGSFVVDAVDPAATDDNYALGPVALPHIKAAQEYEFYIYNNLTTVSISANAWDLFITPLTYVPA